MNTASSFQPPASSYLLNTSVTGLCVELLQRVNFYN